MKLQKCANGHFYDGDKFSVCPHCGASAGVQGHSAPSDDDVTRPGTYFTGGNAGDPGVTMPLTGMGGNVGPTMPLTGVSGGNVKDTMPLTGSGDITVPAGADGGNSEDKEKTFGFYNWGNTHEEEENFEPPVGWLVCISGKQRGKDYRLVAGRNSIGRGEGSAVRLSGEETVSRTNHASVVFEPRQNKFYAVPGDSRALAYLNDEVLLARTEMKKNDRLELGKAVVMLIPCCDGDFRWE